jgi:hypothetical protein
MIQLVCQTCMMKIPSELHAKAHRIVLGHESVLVDLDD